MLILAALPAECWTSADNALALLLEDCTRFYDLLQKTANQGLNSRRLTASRQAACSLAVSRVRLCDSLAGFTEALAAGYYPGVVIDSLLPDGIPFACVPSATPAWLTKLRFRASWLPDEIQRQGMGFIFLEDIYISTGFITSGDDKELSAMRIANQEISIIPGQDLDMERTSPGIQISENEEFLFGLEAERVLKENSALNAGLYHHPVLTAGLQRLFHALDEPAVLGILYPDNSRAADFPVRRSRANPQKEQLARAAKPLRCALMSMRHLEMDAQVDLAWFQNQEISLKGVTSAEIDRQCTERSLSLLAALPEEELTVIWMYQTGFQPAVVGFYRAVAQVLLSESKKLAVLPMIYQASGSYRPGDWWV